MAEKPNEPDRPDAGQNPEQTKSEAGDFHILVVDDDREVLQVLCHLLEADGYRVTGVPGGREALEVIGKEKVDLILTDLMMPEVNGWQLLRAVKTRFKDLPVVVITGYMAEQGESILTNQHVDGYLIKPVDHQRLQTLLSALLVPQNLGRQAEAVAVDDDPDTLEAIEESLSRRGLFVTSYRDGTQALQYIRKDPPDLFIIDLMLPGVDGFGLCHSIRTDPDIAHIPILILSAYSSKENVVRAVKLGVNGFIAKPFDASELGEKALQLLRQTGSRFQG
jgi:CheY-like chemotaxis protein